MLRNEDDINRDINKKLQLINNLLNHTYEILKLFEPIMTRIAEMDEAKKYKNNGVFKRAGYIFNEISQICRKIEDNSFPSNTFLENLGN